MRSDAFSPKQMDFFQKATHRWNIKTGATRSGKTYMDYFVIPKRILAAPSSGLVTLIGNTKATLERNILTPMRDLYGPRMVGTINPQNGAIQLFGRHCFAMGAGNVGAVSKLQGTGIAYGYGDEMTTWNEKVFEMLKSRLDKPGSCFDGTCNPDAPTHWMRKFLDSDADIYEQTYTLYDNPYNSPEFVHALETEYRGTVYFGRYIRGLWVAAEGVIYKPFASNPDAFIRSGEPDDLGVLTIGVDFGGNGSATAFILSGISTDFRRVEVLEEYYRHEIVSPEQLCEDFVAFCRMCQGKYQRVYTTYADSAEQTLIQGLRAACLRAGVMMDVQNARKGPINDRIRFVCAMMGAKRFAVSDRCPRLIEAMKDAVWDSNSIGKDVRLDDGKHNIDSLDAMEYSLESYMADMMYR